MKILTILAYIFGAIATALLIWAVQRNDQSPAFVMVGADLGRGIRRADVLP